MHSHLIKAATTYLSKGVSVIATDNNKRALFPWKEYQQRHITPQELDQQFTHFKAQGIAVICGKVSGGLEVIDIDSKNDVTGNLYQNIIDNIPEEIYSKLLIIRTKSGGYHFYYRCEKIEGNQKFAMRPATDQELKESPHLKQVVLIESRGEAGYVIAPPTEGYTAVKKKEIPTITIEQRETLLEICRSFNEITEEVLIIPTADKRDHGAKPWDDYNEKADCIALLVKHGWVVVSRNGERTYLKRPGKTTSQVSADFHHGLNLFKVFTTSSEFQPGKGYKPFGVYCLLEHKGNPSEAAKQLIKEGYGDRGTPIDNKLKRPIRKLREAGYDNAQIKDKLVRDHNVSSSEAEEIIHSYDQQAGPTIATFWDVDDKGKISISRNKLERFLKYEGGFSLFFYDANSSIYRMVKEKDGFVEETSTERIKKFIKNYIYTLEPAEPFDHGTTVSGLMEVILKGADAYFSKGLLEFLDERKFDFLKDTKDMAYFPFKNGVVCVSSDSITLKSYGEINKVIWRSQVIDFDITIDKDFEPSLCEFHRFINLVSGQEQDRLEYCIGIIGYLLHKHKNFTRPWAIVLAEETDDESKGGGTGKGILVKAVSYMTTTQRVDGKNFKLDKNFAFQRIGLDTKVVAIEDVRKNVDFEGFYSIITEGMTVEKKNKDELYIPYNDSPKVMFTTNYTIASNGIHAKRRQKVFEFSPYFNQNNTPLDEFGHQLFEDWDNDEWNRFYNMMFVCVQKYLKNGIVEVVNSEKLKRKHIKINYTEEFLEFFDQMIRSQEEWKVFNDQYTYFLKQNEWDKKEYSNKRFKKALAECTSTMGYTLINRRNWNGGGQTEFKIEGVPVIDNQKEEESEVRYAF